MADAASTVIGLIPAILRTILEIQRAQECIRGQEKMLRTIAYQLDSTSKSLILIKDEPNLQTPSVQQFLPAVAQVAEDLKGFFYQLQKAQRQRALRRFVHALKSGEDDEKALAAFMHRLDGARNELILRITVAQVGLMGNMNEGFRVSAGVLLDTNRKCAKILGRELTLARHLKGRRPQRDGRIILDKRDIQALRLTDPSNMKNIPRRNNVVIDDNVMLGRARVTVGDIGPFGWRKQQSGNRDVQVTRNQFGDDLHMFVGDVEGPAAVTFFQSNFWN